VTVAVHPRAGCQDDAGELVLDAAFQPHHRTHRQAGRIQPVQSRGDHHVALLDVGIGGHEAQLQRAWLGAAVDDAAQAVAQDLHCDRLVLVSQQGDLRRGREHASHLPDHTNGVDHRLACLQARRLALAQHELAAEPVARLVYDFGDPRGHAATFTDRKKRSQVRVLGAQLLGLLQLLGPLDGLAAQRLVLAVQPLDRGEVVARAPQHGARHQHGLLQRIHHHGETHPHRLQHLQARIDHDQRDRKE